MTDKPHKGIINDWWEVPFDKDIVRSHYDEDPGLGYFIRGRVYGHVLYGSTSSFHTSWVVSRNGSEIETRNSRYTLGAPLDG